MLCNAYLGHEWILNRLFEFVSFIRVISYPINNNKSFLCLWSTSTYTEVKIAQKQISLRRKTCPVWSAYSERSKKNIEEQPGWDFES